MTNVPLLSVIIATYNLTEIQEKHQEAAAMRNQYQLEADAYKAAELLVKHGFKPGQIITMNTIKWKILDGPTYSGVPVIERLDGKRKIGFIREFMEYVNNQKVTETPPDGCSLA